MDQLVAQDVEPVEYEAERSCRIAVLKRLCEGPRRRFDPRLPVLETGYAVVVLPERAEHVAVLHQEPHRSGETLPDRAVDTAFLVQRDQPAEIPHEGGPLDRRPEEHTSELQSLMRNSYADFCLKKKRIEHNTALHPRTPLAY